MKKKERYEQAEIGIVEFDIKDVIATSQWENKDGSTGGGGHDEDGWL